MKAFTQRLQKEPGQGSRKRISTTLLLILVPIIAVSIIFIILFLSSQAETQIRALSEDSLQDESDFNAQKFGARVQNVVARGEAFVKSAESVDFASKKAYQDFMNMSVNMGDLENQGIYTGFEDGSMYYADYSAVPDGYDPRARGWYQTAMKDNLTSFTITDPYVDALSNALCVSYIKKITLKNGDAGACGIDIFLSELAEETAKMKPMDMERGISAIVGGGMILGNPDTSINGKTVSEAGNALLEQAAAKVKPENPELIKDGNVTYYVAASEVPNTNWTLYSAVPESDILASLRAFQKICIVIMVIILVVITIILLTVISTVITVPLRKVTTAAVKISEGDFDVDLPTESQNEIGQLAVAFSKTTEQLKNYQGYIDEISGALSEVSEGNLNIELKREYVGQFAKLKINMDKLVSNLRTIVGSIMDSAKQVDSGAVQISDGAQGLAQGATEQASSIEELSAEISQINDETMHMADNARIAQQQIHSAEEQINTSNTQMIDLRKAMEDITDKSQRISTIIKTIDDIAFQTNILALNAAVEAARAGAAGKGFAVVADEVRNLAGKSSTAALDTSNLITETIAAVQTGDKLTIQTAEYLRSTQESTKKAVELIAEITGATDHQKRSLNDIKQGIDQISSVVQTNAATAEESAAASQELTRQANVLSDEVHKFSL